MEFAGAILDEVNIQMHFLRCSDLSALSFLAGYCSKCYLVRFPKILGAIFDHDLNLMVSCIDSLSANHLVDRLKNLLTLLAYLHSDSVARWLIILNRGWNHIVCVINACHSFLIILVSASFICRLDLS